MMEDKGKKLKIEFTRSDTKVIKGVAILLMLYHHLFAFPKRISETIEYQPLCMMEGQTSSYLMGVFGKLCVALFLFLGGYGLYISCKGKEHITILTKNKVIKLYTVYWLVMAAFLPVWIMKTGEENVAIETFFGNLSGLKTTYNGEWWFFTPYVLLLLSYPLIKKFHERKQSTPLGDMIFVILLSVFVYKILPDIVKLPVLDGFAGSFGWSKLKEVLQQLPSFFMGGIFAKYDILSYVKKNYGNNTINSILALLAVIILFWSRRFMGMEFDCVIAPGFVVAVIIFLQLKPMAFLYRFFQIIGNESTFIWLTHSFYCYDLCQEFIFMPKYSILIVLLLLAVSYGTAVVLKKGYKLLAKGYQYIHEKTSD